MKISKLILASFILGGMSSVFAAPVKLFCQYNGEADGFEVEFDELDKTKIIVAGNKIPSIEKTSDLVIKNNIYEISNYIIKWGSEDESRYSSYNATDTYTINRSTGKIEYKRVSSVSGEKSRGGECMKADNVVKKF